MILLWGVAQDGTLAAVRTALDRRGAATFFLDQTRGRETEIEWEAGRSVTGRIGMGETSCDLGRLGAVYLRPYSTRAVIGEADQAAAAHADRLDESLYTMLEMLDANVVNRLSAMASNSSKPYQLGLIAAQGFTVPDTLVCTDPASVLAFQARHGKIIYKSVSGVRSIVRRFSAEDTERLADIGWCPTQFQQYVAGRDYRVHVVGEDLFTCEIVSEADDYRYASRDGETVDIVASRVPEPVERNCRALAKALGLSVAGIDLRLTPGGEWYCFEVNPSPAFGYYEQATGLPIAEAMAGLLSRGLSDSI